MRFARVQGFLLTDPAGPVVDVTLDDGRQVISFATRSVPDAVRNQPAAWLADQLTQDVLGNELAEDGWEILSMEPASDDGAVPASPIWTVRRSYQ